MEVLTGLMRTDCTFEEESHEPTRQAHAREPRPRLRGTDQAGWILAEEGRG
jgi:hypothetical protein